MTGARQKRGPGKALKKSCAELRIDTWTRSSPRLVQRLIDPARPLSRNRHFHTFDSPEGRAALRVTRRLESLKGEISSTADAKAAAWISTSHRDDEGNVKMEIRFERVRGRRTSLLSSAEFELLKELPDVKELLGAP